MMSRKDYRAFASILHSHGTKDDTLLRKPEYVIEEIAEDMAVLFGNDNPNFDRSRFLAAVREG